MPKRNTLNPRKLPSQERSRLTVAAIYEAAAQVFTKNGYSATTTDMIAERAGVSIGTLYQYFPSKDAILVGLWEHHFMEGREIVKEVIGDVERTGAIDQRLTPLLIKRIIDINMSHRAQHRLFVGDLPWPKTIIDEEIEFGRFLKGYLESIFRNSSQFRIKNPMVAAHIVYETVYALVHDYILHWVDEIPLDEFIRELSEMINRYLFTLAEPAS